MYISPKLLPIIALLLAGCARHTTVSLPGTWRTDARVWFYGTVRGDLARVEQGWPGGFWATDIREPKPSVIGYAPSLQQAERMVEKRIAGR